MKINNITNNQYHPTFKGLYNNKLLLKSLKLASQNSALFSATVSLGLSTIARPVSIMSTPKTDKENKKLATAKSVSSSIVGYLIMLLASMPVAKAVKKIDTNPKKYLKESTINNLKNGAQTLTKSKSYMFATQIFKLGLGLIIAMPKSALTCALIPTIMSVLFHKKHKDTNQGKNTNNQAKGKIISFKGLYNQATDKIAQGIGKVIDTSCIQKASKKFYDTNIAQHIMSLTDILLTFSFVKQVSKNKKIAQERKKPLIHNSLISTGLCLTGGYAVNSALNKPTEKFIKKFKEINKDLPELERYIEGIKIAKPALILGGIYYVIIPIISTFLADRTGDKSIKDKPLLLK